MTEIVRSEEQIRKLIAALEEERSMLPSHNFFGDSNEDEIKEMGEWIVELEIALEDGMVRDITTEAGHWLTSPHGTLGADYGVD